MSSKQSLYEEACRLRDAENITAEEASKRVGLNKNTFAYYAKKSSSSALTSSKQRIRMPLPVSIPFATDVPRGTSPMSITGSPEDLAAFLVAIGKGHR